MAKRIVVVDLSGVFWRNLHICKKNDEVSEAVKWTVDQVKNVSDEGDVTIIAVDHPPYWRSDPGRGGWEHYKGDRPEKDPLDIEMLRGSAKALKKAGYPLLHTEGYEADDIIAAVAARAVELGHNCRIVSCDKDVYSCLRTGGDPAGTVDLINIATPPGKEPLWTEGRLYESMGIRPRQMPLYLALTGDTVDNLPGVEGIGPKTAKTILQKFGKSNPTELAEEHMTKTQWSKLQSAEPDFYHQCELTTLLTNALPAETIDAAIEGRKPQPNPQPKPQPSNDEPAPASEEPPDSDPQPDLEEQTAMPELPVSPNLEAALLVAQRAAMAVEKDSRNTHHKYDYASANAVTAEGRRVCLEAGVLVRRVNWKFSEKEMLVYSHVRVTHPESGEKEEHTFPFPVVPGNGRPIDKALAAALTTGYAFWWLGFMGLRREDADSDISGRDDTGYQPKNSWHSRERR